WLAPRLPRFNRVRPGIDVRIVASNDKPDLDRDQLDVAIRFVAQGADAPEGDWLFACKSFPACSPALARNETHPIRTPADLAHHVRLDYETVRDGKRLSEWDFWFDSVKLRRVEPASTLQFPQFDQTITAAVEGSGVGMGVLPHVIQHLREGGLCVPFGRDLIADRGNFFIVTRPHVAGRDAVEAFAAWLRSEVRRDGGPTLAMLGPPRPRRQTRASVERSRAR